MGSIRAAGLARNNGGEGDRTPNLRVMNPPLLPIELLHRPMQAAHFLARNRRNLPLLYDSRDLRAVHEP